MEIATEPKSLSYNIQLLQIKPQLVALNRKSYVQLDTFTSTWFTHDSYNINQEEEWSSYFRSNFELTYSTW